MQYKKNKNKILCEYIDILMSKQLIKIKLNLINYII